MIEVFLLRAVTTAAASVLLPASRSVTAASLRLLDASRCIASGRGAEADAPPTPRTPRSSFQLRWALFHFAWVAVRARLARPCAPEIIFQPSRMQRQGQQKMP